VYLHHRRKHLHQLSPKEPQQRKDPKSSQPRHLPLAEPQVSHAARKLNKMTATNLSHCVSAMSEFFLQVCLTFTISSWSNVTENRELALRSADGKQLVPRRTVQDLNAEN
jgi:hypothetical protein